MYELKLITDLVEEKLVKGKLRWLANFKEIHRDYKMGELVIPLYATGGLEEKGFFLSKVFSTLVTPKYKIHFLFFPSPEIDVKSLRSLIIACKNKFTGDDWIFVGIVQSNPIRKALKAAIENIADNRVGVAAYSLNTKTAVSSRNVLGKALKKQLKLTEAKFEAFDLPNYLKSFTMMFFLGTLIIIGITLFSNLPAVHPVTLLLVAVLSVVAGHKIYKSQYHTTLTLNNQGFELREGKKITRRKWSNFKDVTICITPKHEICLRLYSKERTFDLPISRVGISRKEAYYMIRQLIERKKTTQ